MDEWLEMLGIMLLLLIFMLFLFLFYRYNYFMIPLSATAAGWCLSGLSVRFIVRLLVC